MKKILLGLAFALAFGTVQAKAEGLYLHVMTNDGNWTVLNLDRVDRLYFDNSNMTAKDKTDNTVARYSRASLATMQVNDDSNAPTDYSSGIEDAAVASGKIIYDAINERITYNGVDAAMEIYDLNGQRLVNIPDYRAGQSVYINALSKGVYVVKIGGSTLKIAVK